MHINTRCCVSLQHPAHRLRLSEILSHPFMTDQSPHQPPSQETPLPKNQPLIRGAHPFSQASMDSGQYTMSSSQSVNKGGPLRATVRPHGIENHLPPPPSSIASTDSSIHSRHCSTQSTLSNRPAIGHRKTQSVDGLPFSAKSSHNHSATKTPASLKDSKHHSHSCEDIASSNKENASSQHSRRAKSDFESRGSRQANSTRPFKDRTNVQTERPRLDDRKAVERSSGSLKALVPPLNAARLRPIKQQTRSAIVRNTLLTSAVVSSQCIMDCCTTHMQCSVTLVSIVCY